MTVPALIALGVDEGTSAYDPGFLVLCGLLVLAPACLFLPAGRVVGRWLWALEAIVAWALLGYLLAFVNPQALDRGAALTVFFPSLFGALASPALLLTARRVRAGEPSGSRTREQGYVIAGICCGVLLLNALDALTLANLALFGLIAVSAQGLFLARDKAQTGTRQRSVTAPIAAPASGGAGAPPDLVAPALIAPLRPSLVHPVGRGPR